MPHTRSRWLLPFACGVLLLGCSADGSADNGGGASRYVGVDLAVVTTSGSFTLRRAQLYFDGTLVDDESYSPAVQSMTLGGSFGANPGAHTVSVKIIGQDATPGRYDFFGTLVSETLSTASQTESIELQSDNHTIATGSSYSFSVTIH